MKYKRVYKIETGASGGTITPKVTGIDKGEDRTITYTADKGYYLRRLRVDGKEVDVKRYPTSYTFHDISSDHVIRAKFLPIRNADHEADLWEEMYPASGDRPSSSISKAQLPRREKGIRRSSIHSVTKKRQAQKTVRRMSLR
ncbi:MAG: hypothetical protein ACLRTA_04965 [Clostridia bacterium]